MMFPETLALIAKLSPEELQRVHALLQLIVSTPLTATRHKAMDRALEAAEAEVLAHRSEPSGEAT